MQNLQHILIERPEPFVTIVRLDRPSQRNALNDRLWK